MTKPKTFKCPECGKTSKTAKGISDHFASVHRKLRVGVPATELVNLRDKLAGSSHEIPLQPILQEPPMKITKDPYGAPSDAFTLKRIITYVAVAGLLIVLGVIAHGYINDAGVTETTVTTPGPRR